MYNNDYQNVLNDNRLHKEIVIGGVIVGVGVLATVALAAFYFAGKSRHVLGFSWAPTAASETLEILI